MAMEPLTVILNFGVFPVEHTCDGANRSPAITILGVKTPYLAIVMEDPDASRGAFTHWIIWNIPAAERIPEGLPTESILSEPITAVQGTNDSGKVGYTGPCPPQGESHRYLFRIYGLDAPLNLPPGADRIALGRAMGDVIRQYGEAAAAYGRSSEEMPPRC
ncbi:MAG: YbhB/YbcL family Raf kinase inhibitor-like protein [Methanoculleus thermophilus]|nr:YbhB/YbcL family Raf kinase inhibitor-like protein [Methanoculleus thermophilus]